MNKYIISSVSALVILLAIVGAYKYPKSEEQVSQFSAVGDTYSTRKIAQVVMDMTTTTPASLLNGDSRDRIITSIDYYAASLTNFTSNGTGLANLIWLASTSSAPYVASSANYILNTTVATTTAQLFVASSTPGVTASAFARVWASGSYLNVFANGTSTATGIVVVNYVVSQ